MNRALIKKALKFNLDLDGEKILSIVGEKSLKAIPYGVTSGALGALEGGALGDNAKIISGNSGFSSGVSIGAVDSAIAGTLAGTALEILTDPVARSTPEGKAAAALATAIAAAIAWRKTSKIMLDTQE